MVKKKKPAEVEVTNLGDNGHPSSADAKLDEILNGIGKDIDELTGAGPSASDHIEAEQKLGVLQRLVTAVMDDTYYRQALLTAAFDSKAEALLCADAITERKRYGVAITPIVDRVIAQCAVDGKRSLLVTQAINSFTLRTNQFQPKWKKTDDKQGIR